MPSYSYLLGARLPRPQEIDLRDGHRVADGAEEGQLEAALREDRGGKACPTEGLGGGEGGAAGGVAVVLARLETKAQQPAPQGAKLESRVALRAEG